MKIQKCSWSVLPLSLLLFSCGSTPEGKFKDDKSNTGNGGPGAGQTYIHNASATTWDNSWSKQNVVVYHWRNEPDNLHPTNGKSTSRRVVMDYTQRFLISTDMEKLQLRPDLVKSMPAISADGLSYTYELREEPTWDDGSPVTVGDVIFSLKAAKNPLTNNPLAKPYLEMLSDITTDAANPRKFTLVMNKKYIQNIAFLTDIPVMQEKFYDPGHVLTHYTFAQFNDPAFANAKHPDLQAWSDNFNDTKYGLDINFLTGCGAYKVTAWEPKVRIELTRKQNHWTSKLQNPDMYNVAYPEKIIFQIITDDNGISLGLKQQTIDVSTWISTQGLIDLQKDSAFVHNYHSAFVPNFNYQYIGMNMKPESVNRMPFFTDAHVRHAMALLTPIDKIIQSYYDGKAMRMVSLIPPSKPAEVDQSLKPVPFDVDQAKKLLDDAGWKDTDGDNIRDKVIDGKKVQFSFELLYIAGSAVTENIAKDIAAAMYSAGIKANLRSLEFVAFYDQVQLHQFDMYLGAWGGSFAPDDFKQIWGSDNWANKGSNYVGFGTPQSDAVIDSIRSEINDTVRIGMEKRLQRIVYNDQPYIFLMVPPVKTAIHKRFDHADMYFEKPGVFLSNLRAMSPGSMATNAPTN